VSRRCRGCESPMPSPRWSERTPLSSPQEEG
jgi:hypothetical protein